MVASDEVVSHFGRVGMGMTWAQGQRVLCCRISCHAVLQWKDFMRPKYDQRRMKDKA